MKNNKNINNSLNNSCTFINKNNKDSFDEHSEEVDILEYDDNNLDLQNLKHKFESLKFSSENEIEENIKISNKMQNIVRKLKKEISYLKQDNIDDLNYSKLLKLEKYLTNYLNNVKKKINQIEAKYIDKKINIKIISNCIECNCNKINILFYPCHHLIYCYNCYFNHKLLIKTCLKCGEKIDKINKIYY